MLVVGAGLTLGPDFFLFYTGFLSTVWWTRLCPPSSLSRSLLKVKRKNAKKENKMKSVIPGKLIYSGKKNKTQTGINGKYF